MGASNVNAAFHLYAGRVPHASMNLLAYMANISMDRDAEPWYGEGHEALARFAFGRGRHAQITSADLKAVERSIAPLRKIGAISTDRRAAPRREGSKTARYRLHLDVLGALFTPRIPGGDQPGETPINGAVDNANHPPDFVRVTPRFSDSHPPKNVQTPPEKRGAEDTGGYRRSEKFKEEDESLRRPSPSPAREPPQDHNWIEYDQYPTRQTRRSALM